MTSNPGVASAQTPPTRTAPTPAAWGSGRGEAAAPPVEKKRASGAMWVGLGIVGAAAIAGAVVLLQGRSGGSSPPAPAVAHTLPSSLCSARRPSRCKAPAVAPAASLAPAPSATAVETAAVAASAAPSASPRPGVTPPAFLVTKPGAGPARTPGNTTPPGSKPKGTDDDIPSLR